MCDPLKQLQFQGDYNYMEASYKLFRITIQVYRWSVFNTNNFTCNLDLAKSGLCYLKTKYYDCVIFAILL